MSKSKTHSSNSGFSLIEILIASVVLVTVLIGLSNLLSYVIRSDSQASARVIAGDLAQEGADFFRQERNVLGYERLREQLNSGIYCLNNLPYSQEVDDVFAVSPGDCATGLAGYQLAVDRVAQNFKRTATVELPQGDPHIIQILISVSWLNDRNEETSVTSQLYLRPR